MICESCGRDYEYDRRCNSTKKCASCHVNNRRFERKKRLVELLGGRCARCGYDKSVYALDFHHIDPATKLFNVRLRALGNAVVPQVAEVIGRLIVQHAESQQ